MIASTVAFGKTLSLASPEQPRDAGHYGIIQPKRLLSTSISCLGCGDIDVRSMKLVYSLHLAEPGARRCGYCPSHCPPPALRPYLPVRGRFIDQRQARL